MTGVAMTVIGKAVSGDLEGRTQLMSFRREGLGLTGTRVGCNTSRRGACVVQVDGKPGKSCTVFVRDPGGAPLRKIEGMTHADGSPSVIRQAFQTHHGLQAASAPRGMVMPGRRRGQDLRSVEGGGGATGRSLKG
jgi:carbon-monoxide dehydrogenase small subunit